MTTSMTTTTRRSVSTLLAAGPLAALAVLASALPAAAAPDPDDVSAEAELTDALTVVDSSSWAGSYVWYFGEEYVPPLVYTGAAGVQGMYTSGYDSELCGGEEALTAYNALHCADPVGSDWISVSDDLLSYGTSEIGDAFTYLVVAHEWGHAIQQRQPQYTAPWTELQADCLAGATLAEASAQGLLTWDEGDDAELAAGREAVADETGWTDTTSHGSAQERIAFFQHGIETGITGCLYTGMEP